MAAFRSEVTSDHTPESETDEEQEECQSSDNEKLTLNQGNKKAKARGRRSSWDDNALDDLVDVICTNEYYRKKLIFQNTKNTSNSYMYQKIIEEVKSRCKERGSVFLFTVKQTRTKFKTCISSCKTAAMTIKSATGIQRFQDNKGFGKWFAQLYPYVQSRDSAQPQEAVEPSTLLKRPSSSTSCASDTDIQHDSEGEGKHGIDNRKKKIFVPVKNKKTDPLAEVVKTFNKFVEKDTTSELLNFLKEENERSRHQEMDMFKLQMQTQMQMHTQMMQQMQQQMQQQMVPPPLYPQQAQPFQQTDDLQEQFYQLQENT